MSAQDWVVGTVSIALGAIAVWHALLAEERLKQLTKYRVLIDAMGKSGAKWTVTIVGLVLVAVGLLVIIGFRLPWQR